MATVVKDLGAVTAYAYAVAGGYSGTEAEFEALLGNIAEDLSEIENLSVTVTTLPAGSSATASYSNGVLSLGIPKGDKGDKGDTGATGATGPQGIPGDVANLASAYSTSSTYGVGDYCIYNSQLYRCTTAITTAEAWTVAHWTAAVLGNDVGELKNATTKLDNEIFDYTSAVNTDAWTYNNNNAVTSNGDGTYNIGTSDYGTTAWGGNAIIYPGTYKLFGSPYGLVFVSPNTSYASAIVSNDTGAEKIVTISEAGMYYVGVRTGANPPASYVLTPYLIKVDNIFDSLLSEFMELKQLVESGFINVPKFIQGARGVSGEPDTTDFKHRCTTYKAYNLAAGDSIAIASVDNGLKVAIAGVKNNSYVYDSGWKTEEYAHTVQENDVGTYFVNISKTDGTSISPSDILTLKVQIKNSAFAPKKIESPIINALSHVAWDTQTPTGQSYIDAVESAFEN